MSHNKRTAKKHYFIFLLTQSNVLMNLGATNNPSQSGGSNSGQSNSGTVRNEHLSSHQQQLGDRLYPKVSRIFLAVHN